MSLSWLSVFVFFLGFPFQVSNQNSCDHAAPPPGMRWVCSDKNSCDCQLVPHSGGRGFDEDGRKAEVGPIQCEACRLLYFVFPEYPEAARKAHKEGMVTATLVLSGEGRVEDVRVQSGDPALASAVQMTLKQWRFTASNREESLPVSVKFELSDRPGGVVSGSSLLNPVIVARPMR